MTAADRPAPETAEATALVRLGAAAADGDPATLEAVFGAVTDLVPTDDVEELLLQTHLFAGFPRAIEAFRAWQGWLDRRGRARGRLLSEEEAPGEWRRRGEALCRRVYGENFEALQRRLSRLHPALAEWTLVEGYGKVLSRPDGPDAPRRELAAIGSLVALDAERQLASHLLGALHVGVPRDILVAAVRAVAEERGRGVAVDRLLSETADG